MRAHLKRLCAFLRPMLLRYWVRPLAHRSVAVCCSVLQCVAACWCCNVFLRPMLLRYWVRPLAHRFVAVFSSMLQSVAVCFRGWGCCDIFYRALLQKRPVKEPCSFAKEPCKPYYLKEPTWVRPYAHKFVALCCSMLQRIGVAVCLRGRVCYATGSDLRHSGLLRCVAVCCSVLQRVSVAVCFRGGVAQARQNFGTQVCCSVLQCVAVCCSVLVLQCVSAVVLRKRVRTLAHMGWLRLVCSFKLQVSFAEYSLFYRALLQNRPII